MRVFLVLAAISMLWSCGKDHPTAELSGNVYFSATEIPVGGALIKLDQRTVTSNIQGKYRIEGIAGKYHLVAQKEGFHSYYTDIVISEGVTNLDIDLTSIDYTCTLLGYVRGSYTGSLQPGIVVVLLNPDGRDSKIITETTEEGFFRLFNVPLGERTIVARSEGVIVFQETYFFENSEIMLDIIIPEPFEFVDERDGNVYHALKIGTQTWMLENLAWLPSVSGPSSGSYLIPYYYVYAYEGIDVDEAKLSGHYRDFGVFYNWVAARNCCPEGWHLPDDDEWKTLERFLGMTSYDTYRDGARWEGEIGIKIKSKYGWNNDGNGDNSSKMNVLPVGGRFDQGGFDTLGDRAALWTSTESSSVFAWGRSFGGNVSWVDRDRFDRSNGLSVRCIMD